MIHTSMIKPLIVSILAAVAVVGSAFSAQVGDVVQEKLQNAVILPNSQTRQVLSIVLDKGTWLVSGQLNFLERRNGGRSTVAGGVNDQVNLPADGTAMFQSDDTNETFQIEALTLAPKAFQVFQDNVTVFLVAQNVAAPNLPLQPSFVRAGLLTAVKIKAN
jgi:hypothetical protein